MKKPAEPQPVRSAEVIEVIKVKALTGRGSRDDAAREVDQYFTPVGGFLFKVDRFAAEEVRLRTARLKEIVFQAERLRTEWIAMLEKKIGKKRLHNYLPDSAMDAMVTLTGALNDHLMHETGCSHLELVRDGRAE